MKKFILALLTLIYTVVAFPQAMNAIQKAAENGDVEAQLYLGRCYQEGKNGVNKNLLEANKWLLKAAQQGNPEAQYDLSQLLINNRLYEDCSTDGVNWMKKAADNGNLRAVTNYAFLCFEMIKDYDSAFQYFKISYDAIEPHQPPTSYYLGLSYLFGLGTQIDLKKSFELLEFAFNNNVKDAASYASICSIQLKNYEKARFYAEKACEYDQVWGFDVLAELYHEGLGVKKDLQKAIQYSDLFIERVPSIEDKLKAIRRILSIYTDGNSGLKDQVKIRAYMEKASNMGDLYVTYCLGRCFLGGDFDFPINYDEAKKWYTIAKEGGVLLGYNDLAFMYAKGLGVQQNYEEAYRLLDEALTLYDKQIKHFEFDWNRDNLLDSKGEILLWEGRFDEALAIYNQIKNTEDPKIKDSEFFAQMASYLNHSIDAINFTATTKNDKTFVVIIANENYKRVDNVPYALNDGKLFKKYCVQALGIPESNIKIFDDASGNDIKFGVNWLKQAASVHVGQSKIIFYYAGHGIPDESNKNAYLLPVDGYGSDISTGYSLEELYSTLGSIPAKNVMVFLDACFSGTKRDGSMLASARGVAIKAKQTAPSGKMVVLSAAQGDETAYPFEDQKHGMFTYYLLRKLLETKGEATLGVLADFVTSEVAKQSVIQNNKAQTPTVSHSALSSDWRNWKLK